MSSLFSHVFFPLVLLLIFSDRLKIHRWNIILLAVFGILPDADIFLHHRALFHNIFILFIPLIFFIFVKTRKDIPGIICFYLASHILLDIFNGGAYVLYPFYEKAFYINAEIAFRNNIFFPLLNYGVSPVIINNGGGEPVISSENIAVAMVIILSSAIAAFRNRINI